MSSRKDGSLMNCALKDLGFPEGSILHAPTGFGGRGHGGGAKAFTMHAEAGKKPQPRQVVCLALSDTLPVRNVSRCVRVLTALLTRMMTRSR